LGGAVIFKRAASGRRRSLALWRGNLPLFNVIWSFNALSQQSRWSPARRAGGSVSSKKFGKILNQNLEICDSVESIY